MSFENLDFAALPYNGLKEFLLELVAGNRYSGMKGLFVVCERNDFV